MMVPEKNLCRHWVSQTLSYFEVRCWWKDPVLQYEYVSAKVEEIVTVPF